MGFSISSLTTLQQSTSNSPTLDWSTFDLRFPLISEKYSERLNVKYSLKIRSIGSARKYHSSILPFTQDLVHNLRKGRPVGFNKTTPKYIIDKESSYARISYQHTIIIEILIRSKYIRFLRQRGEHRFFHKLRQHRDGYSHQVSRWYRLFKQRLGFDATKNFHSFVNTSYLF